MVTSTRLQGFLGQGMTYNSLFFFPRGKKKKALGCLAQEQNIPQPHQHCGWPGGAACPWDGSRRCCRAQEDPGGPTKKQRRSPSSCDSLVA